MLSKDCNMKWNRYKLGYLKVVTWNETDYKLCYLKVVTWNEIDIRYVF